MMKYIIFLLLCFTILVLMTGCQTYEYTEYYDPQVNGQTFVTKAGELEIFGPVKSKTTQSGYRESDLGNNATIKVSAF